MNIIVLDMFFRKVINCTYTIKIRPYFGADMK